MRTFSLLVLAILGFAFVACDDDDHLGDWAKAPEFSGRLRNQAVSFVIGDYAYVGTGFGVDLAEYTDFKKYNLNDGTWTDVPDNFPGKGRHGAVAFVAEKGGKTYAYVGLGYISANQIQGSDGTAEIRAKEYLKDFYRFDPTDNSWTKIEDFPGEARRDAVAFTLDNYGYVGTGRADKALLFKDFYCFDPETETWNTEELGFKGDQRYGASAFVVNGAAYVCLGAKGSGYAQDVIKCTPLGGGKVAWDNMQALTDKPGVKQDKDYDRIPRAFAVSFISNKGNDGESYAYIATGTGNNPSTVWKYNHKKDQWHQMEDLAPSAGNVVGAVSFVADGYGYYTTGGTSIDPIDANSSSSTRYFTNSTWRFIPDVKETRRNDY
ncbi:Kelch repeat-containing protein [Butyricimonas paravirosa]|uniref:Kelch repeat-containing protein n=1 Tax=Butyricimonas paravirosa TaxID=1472417 RepID=UPI00242CE42F|nr:hypothetical protein [Butyricimonas paravirosa]